MPKLGSVVGYVFLVGCEVWGETPPTSADQREMPKLEVRLGRERGETPPASADQREMPKPGMQLGGGWGETPPTSADQREMLKLGMAWILGLMLFEIPEGGGGSQPHPGHQQIIVNCQTLG